MNGTEADFDRLSWHDCHIWGIELRAGDPNEADWTSDLAFDIDFIVEWICGVDRSCRAPTDPGSKGVPRPPVLPLEDRAELACLKRNDFWCRRLHTDAARGTRPDGEAMPVVERETTARSAMNPSAPLRWKHQDSTVPHRPGKWIMEMRPHDADQSNQCWVSAEG